jgi:hypothetical protein
MLEFTLITYIYGLFDPRTGTIRYIGKSNKPKERLKNGHLLSKRKTHKTSWILNLKKEGLTPTLEILDIVKLSEWSFWEQYYISLYKSWGFELTNLTPGGDGITYYTKEVLDKMSKAQKGIKKPEEFKKKISMSAWNTKSVLQYSIEGNFIKEWRTVTEANKNYKVKSIGSTCRGLQRISAGYIWHYKTKDYPMKIQVRKRKNSKTNTNNFNKC